MEERKTKLHDIGVGYVHLDENNQVKYIACTVVLLIWEVRLLLFPNKRREKESQPHYRVSIQVDKRNNQSNQNQSQNQPPPF